MPKIIVNRKKIAIVITSPVTAKVFLLHQITELSKIYDLTLVANFEKDFSIKGRPDWLSKSVHIENIPIERYIKVFADIKAILMLYFFLKNNNFSLIHSITPKAGLIAMISSWAARVPIRIHTYTGQAWATKRGITRFFLKNLDKITSIFSTSILVDSFSQRDFLLKNMIISPIKSEVLGNGSISGINEKIFKTNSLARKNIRTKLVVDNSAIVILFLGRINKEKGVGELIDAFSNLVSRDKRVVLWLVGTDEDRLQDKLDVKESIFWISNTDIPEQYMAAADIFCLPSYREGFGSAVIEAAACGIPAVGSNIYGLSDAIVDKITGILVPVKSVKSLESALQKLVDNKKIREQMGFMAKRRVIENFSQSKMTELLIKHYKSLL